MALYPRGSWWEQLASALYLSVKQVHACRWVEALKWSPYQALAEGVAPVLSFGHANGEVVKAGSSVCLDLLLRFLRVRHLPGAVAGCNCLPVQQQPRVESYHKV